MTRTKQINSPIQHQFNKTTMTDENGEIWIQTSPGNWIKSETYNADKEKGERLKLYYDIAYMTIAQIKQRLQDLGQEIDGPQKNLRKRDYVKKLRRVLC